MPNDKQFRADGTICVRFGANGGINEVTFIPDQYVKQNGSEFVVFVPWEGGTAKADQRLPASEAKLAYVVEAKAVTFDDNVADKHVLLQAAVNRIKVTVLVSLCEVSYYNNGKKRKKRKLKLDGIVIPATSAEPPTC